MATFDPAAFAAEMQTRTRKEAQFDEFEAQLPDPKHPAFKTTTSKGDVGIIGGLIRAIGDLNPLGKNVTKDDVVWLLDNTAFRTSRLKSWQAEYVAAVFEMDPHCKVTDIVSRIAEQLGLADDAAERKTIAERILPFLWDIRMVRIVKVRTEGKDLKMTPTNVNGISTQVMKIPSADKGTIVKSRAVVPQGVSGILEANTVYAGTKGWAILSDIDDTIKITMTSSPTGIVQKTFVDEPTPVPGMPELYAQVKASLPEDTPWFYLSASPYNLYPFLKEFRDKYYPPGTMILRDFSWKTVAGLLSALTMGTEQYKTDRMKKINSWLPERKMIVIGDSTQSDPEAYGEIYRTVPGWIELILIRKVEDVSAIGIADKNHPDRFEKAFEGIPKEAWHVFTEPSECSRLIQDVVGKHSRAKVKCAHDGEPPCSRCAKSKVPGCTLLRPRVDLEKANRVRAKRKEEKRAALAAASQATSAPETSPGMPTPRSSHRTSLRTPQEEHDEADGQDTEDAKLDLLRVDRHIGTLPNSTILKSLNTFSNKFPELAILHLPTFMQEFESPSCSRESMALLAAVLAVARAQLASQGAAWTEGLLSREEYATYAKERLQVFMLKEPRVQVVQALLIITLHEWGTRDFHKAWVYCGIAIRIMQALHSQRVSPYPLDPSSERGRPARNAVTAAIETRAYWACFLMDCMVNSGTYNPPMLPMSEMHKLKIPRPLSAVEFAFGPELPSHTMPLAGGALDITQSFEILVGGFEIWAKVMEFIFNDGRKAPGMCAPHNCPWVPGSPWMSSWSRLRSWRADQHRNLHYPSTSVAVHMTLGYGETFTYLNLLYYVSNLMLHREYTPFLPTPESVPQGPVDKPLLEATAPNGWWEDNAAEIFGSAENIALLLHEASECGVPLMTPFAGFCAFSACYVLVYVYRFPRMNLGRSPRAEECMHMCMDYLHQFRNVWKIADGWIKTLQYASLLYGRAATEGRYRGRTRADFDNLHQSVHEFRVVDRSEQHLQEIDGADRPVEQPDSSRRHLHQHQHHHQQQHHAGQNEPDRFAGSFGFDDQTMDTNMLLNQLMAEVSTNVDEQGAWSQWWPTMQEVELPEGVPLLM